MIGTILLEVFVPVLIRGPGFIIARFLSRSDKVNPDGWLSTVAGFVFWIVLIVSGVAYYNLYISPQ